MSVCLKQPNNDYTINVSDKYLMTIGMQTCNVLHKYILIRVMLFYVFLSNKKSFYFTLIIYICLTFFHKTLNSRFIFVFLLPFFYNEKSSNL